MPDPRRALLLTAAAVTLVLSALAPAASALDVSAKAIRVVGSQTYPDSVQSYAGEVSGSPDEFDGRGVGIAVLDTGVDDDHPAFAGNVFAAGARVQHPCQPNDADCVSDTGPDGDPEGDCINPDDTDGHGTHVASIALSEGGGEIGPRGIAPGARLIDVKIASSLGGISLNGIARGIDWVVKYNKGDAPCAPNPPVSVISISFGTATPHQDKSYDTAMQAVRNATRNGILVVTAAGNCGPSDGGQLDCLGENGDKNTITSPGTTPEALTVGAINDHGTVRRSQDNVADYSSRGPNPANTSHDRQWRKPDVVAPGSQIAAACANTGPTGNPQEGEGMDCNLTGTSMAVPHVSGLAAVLLQARASFPSAEETTPSLIKRLITSTAQDIGAEGWDRESGYGYVDGYAAVIKAVNRPPESEFTVSPTEPEVGTSATFDGSLSFDPDDDSIETYRWTFGDGTDPVETSDPTIDHTYQETGTYTAKLTVVDDHGSEDPDPYRVSINVVNPPPEDPGDPPKAHLTITPRSPHVDQAAVFSAVGTSDPDGHSIVEYRWDFDAQEDTFESERSTTTPETNWTFTEPGSRLVAVRVTDAKGLTDTTYLSVHVRPSPPSPPSVNLTNPQENDTVEPGVLLASWEAEGAVNNFTVFLDSVEEAHLVRRQLRLEVPEGDHTLKIIAKGPGGTDTDWVNFTAVEGASLQQTSTCPDDATTDGTDDACPDGTDAGHDHDDNAGNATNATTTKETPMPGLVALAASLWAAWVARRRC